MHLFVESLLHYNGNPTNAENVYVFQLYPQCQITQWLLVIYRKPVILLQNSLGLFMLHVMPGPTCRDPITKPWGVQPPSLREKEILTHTLLPCFLSRMAGLCSVSKLPFTLCKQWWNQELCYIVKRMSGSAYWLSILQLPIKGRKDPSDLKSWVSTVPQSPTALSLNCPKIILKYFNFLLKHQIKTHFKHQF